MNNTMREILFRGKAINRVDGREYRTNYKNGDWVYGLVTRLYDECFENLPAEMTNTNGISNIDVDYKTIGLYKGLTDKNGKKIFDGDIVEFNLTTDAIGYIKWLDEEAKFAVQYEETDLVDFDSIWGRELEVIGNIHDNPELLDETK